MTQYWFKPKKFGWGISYALCWQGWLSLVVLIGLVLLAGHVDGIFDAPSTMRVYLRFLLDVLVLGVLFCLIFNDKTEGGMKWRWGKEN